MRVGLDFAWQSELALHHKVNEGADMSQGVAMKEGADPDDGMDVRGAAAIMQQASDQAQQKLRINYRLLFATYGLLYLIGYGAAWLSVRGQRPYHGPMGAGLGVLLALATAAVIVTVVVVGRAVTGVGGWTARQRRAALLSYGAGLVGCTCWRARSSTPAPAGP
jgi:hypothetical protein